MKRKNFPGRKDKRRKEAAQRQEAFSKLDDFFKLEKAGAKEKQKLWTRKLEEGKQHEGA